MVHKCLAMSWSKRSLSLLLFLSLYALHSCKSIDLHESSTLQTQDKISEYNEPAKKMLADLVRLYDNYFREARSGLFYDRLSTIATLKPSENISSAATGMGFIVLTIGDHIGAVANAREKIEQGLRSLIELKKTSVRSRDGWFLHWFRADGSLSQMSYADGYSTIDTVILAIGAQMAGEYFLHKNGDDSIAQLNKLLFEDTKWDTAVADVDKGHLYLKYALDGQQTASPLVTKFFNEYVLLPCFARANAGQMANLWNRFLVDPSQLPQITYQGDNLLTDHQEHHVPNFTLQFAYYLCPDIRKHNQYQTFFDKAYRADRAWFNKQLNGRSPLFGLGAGSNLEFDDKTKKVHYGYSANSISDNKFLMASPAIMAGFLPFDEGILQDLVQLKENRTCLYKVGDLEVLWRCSLLNPNMKVEGIEAVDISTAVFGFYDVLYKDRKLIFR